MIRARSEQSLSGDDYLRAEAAGTTCLIQRARGYGRHSEASFSDHYQTAAGGAKGFPALDRLGPSRLRRGDRGRQRLPSDVGSKRAVELEPGRIHGEIRRGTISRREVMMVKPGRSGPLFRSGISSARAAAPHFAPRRSETIWDEGAGTPCNGPVVNDRCSERAKKSGVDGVSSLRGQNKIRKKKRLLGALFSQGRTGSADFACPVKNRAGFFRPVMCWAARIAAHRRFNCVMMLTGGAGPERVHIIGHLFRAWALVLDKVRTRHFVRQGIAPP